MAQKYFLDVVMRKEKLSDGTIVFVSTCPTLGVATQGDSIEDSLNMIKEAIELYLEESKNAEEQLEIIKESFPLFTIMQLEVDGNKVTIQ